MKSYAFAIEVEKARHAKAYAELAAQLRAARRAAGFSEPYEGPIDRPLIGWHFPSPCFPYASQLRFSGKQFALIIV